MKTVITTSSFAVFDKRPLQLLDAHEIDYDLNPFGRKLTADEVIELAKSADGMVAGTEPLDRPVLDGLPQMKVISRCGAGIDNVDLVAAGDLGITVCSTPFGPTLAVAELTLGLMLDLLRKITTMDRELRTGVWKKRMGHLLSGKKVGICGFGRIGRQVADLLAPLGARVAYCDPMFKHADDRKMYLPTLLAWADIITLHCPANQDGSSLIGEREIADMRAGAWLINASRGGLVDENALYTALQDGHIAGAAVDTFINEPYTGPLCELGNVILTPHVGSYAKEGRIQMEIDAVQNLIDAFHKL